MTNETDTKQLTLPTDGKTLDSIGNQTPGSIESSSQASRSVNLELCEPAQTRKRKNRRKGKTGAVTNGDVAQKRLRGRPTLYQDSFNVKSEQASILGLTDSQLAAMLNTNETTLNIWKRKYPEFVESLTRGRIVADCTVAQSLFTRARGYTKRVQRPFLAKDGVIVMATYEEDVEPDVTAQIFWLKNRRPDLWRDRIEHSGTLNQEHGFPPDVLALAKKLADRIQ